MYDFSVFKTKVPRRLRVLQADRYGLHLSDGNSGKVFILEHDNFDRDGKCFHLYVRSIAISGDRELVIRHRNLGALLYLLGYKTKGTKK